MRILVSIITACYNNESTIARTIESVLGQDYADIEYILIDGCSSDRTLEIANSYKDRFCGGKSLRIISEPDNGLYDALNKGVKLASGILIGSINADDWYEPRAVSEMVRFYEHTKYDIAWADLRIHNGRKQYVKKAKVGKVWTTLHFCHPTMFALRDVLIRFPYIENDMDDDFDMILRAHKAGVKILVLNKLLANYTYGGMSTQKSLKKMSRRIAMKYATYKRNGYSKLYLLYCVFIESVKYVWG